MTRRIDVVRIASLVSLAGAALATPTPLSNSIVRPNLSTREVPGINTLILCDAPNTTGHCFTEPITPATLGRCIDFSGANAFLAGALQTVVCPPGFGCTLFTAHDCASALEFGLGPGTFNIVQPFEGLVNSVSVQD